MFVVARPCVDRVELKIGCGSASPHAATLAQTLTQHLFPIAAFSVSSPGQSQFAYLGIACGRLRSKRLCLMERFLKVSGLLFGLNKVGSRHVRKDGLRDWASLLTSYRGATIHEGYMDFEKKHDVQDVARVCTHLKDVIARPVFKECAYDGTYDSPVRSGFGSQEVEWVQPNTTADELGFS
jgi:hypothetical protein